MPPSTKLNAVSRAITAFSTQAVAAGSFVSAVQISWCHIPFYSWGDIAFWISVPTCSCSVKQPIFHYQHFLDSIHLLSVVVCSSRSPLWGLSPRSCLAGRLLGDQGMTWERRERWGDWSQASVIWGTLFCGSQPEYPRHTNCSRNNC